MFLLDTCALLWLVADPSRLSAMARSCIETPDAEVFVSSITAFEVGTKHRKGRLELPLEPEEWFAKSLEFHDLLEIPVNGRIAATSTGLPSLHADPCDRMIIATALEHRLEIVTPDRLIRDYEEASTRW